MGSKTLFGMAVGLAAAGIGYLVGNENKGNNGYRSHQRNRKVHQAPGKNKTRIEKNIVITKQDRNGNVKTRKVKKNIVVDKNN